MAYTNPNPNRNPYEDPYTSPGSAPRGVVDNGAVNRVFRDIDNRGEEMRRKRNTLVAGTTLPDGTKSWGPGGTELGSDIVDMGNAYHRGQLAQGALPEEAKSNFGNGLLGPGGKSVADYRSWAQTEQKNANDSLAGNKNLTAPAPTAPAPTAPAPGTPTMPQTQPNPTPSLPASEPIPAPNQPAPSNPNMSVKDLSQALRDYDQNRPSWKDAQSIARNDLGYSKGSVLSKSQKKSIYDRMGELQAGGMDFKDREAVNTPEAPILSSYFGPKEYNTQYLDALNNTNYTKNIFDPWASGSFTSPLA